jgi:hypothetical protein
MFREVADEVGLRFVHDTVATEEHFFAEITGAGGALFDFDGDGDLDAFLLQGAVIDPAWSRIEGYLPPSTQGPGHRLFRNELIPGGTLSFRDVTEEARLTVRGYGMGAAVGDIDNDGDADLYVTHVGSNVLYRNEGDGTFTDVTQASGTDDPRWSTSAAFVDYDVDGDLDLYVVHYVFADVDSVVECSGIGGRRDYCSPKMYRPLRDRLFRNEGDGRFADVTLQAGIDAVAPGLGVTTADFDDDGWPDIYVANDGEANQLWINGGDGTFEDAGVMSGTAYNAEGKPEGSMGVTAGDFDGDGDEDLFMTHWAAETNTLYVNQGGFRFIDATNRFNLGGQSLSFTGWGSSWFDPDSDGDLDLFVANGGVVIESAQAGISLYPYAQRNQFFVNEGRSRFTEAGAEAGSALELSEVSRGAAFGDVDNDGDPDVLVANSNGPARLLLSSCAGTNHWLRVRLIGTTSNRMGLGARVAVLTTDGETVWRRARTDGSYASGNDPRVHFGLGSLAGIEGVVVSWPAGGSELWHGIEIDAEVALTEGTGQPWPAP